MSVLTSDLFMLGIRQSSETVMRAPGGLSPPVSPSHYQKMDDSETEWGVWWCDVFVKYQHVRREESQFVVSTGIGSEWSSSPVQCAGCSEWCHLYTETSHNTLQSVSPWQWTHQHSQPATNQLFIGSKLRLLLIPEWGAERERGREDHVTRGDIPPHCCLPSIGQLSNIIIIILSWPVFQIENHRDSPLIPEWILIPKSGIRIRISKSTFCPEIWPHDSSSSY